MIEHLGDIRKQHVSVAGAEFEKISLGERFTATSARHVSSHPAEASRRGYPAVIWAPGRARLDRRQKRHRGGSHALLRWTEGRFQLVGADAAGTSRRCLIR